VFTARYALSPYIKQISFTFKGLTHASKHCAVILIVLAEMQKGEEERSEECAKREEK
jgi:hypothetical protein